MPLTLQHTAVVSGMQFALNFPANKLSAGALLPDAAQTNLILRTREMSPGVYRVLAYTKDRAVLKTNASIGQLPFSVPQADLTAGGNVMFSNSLVSSTLASSVAPLTLVNGRVSVASLFRQASGVFDMMLTVQSNRTYVVQATTNFVNWVNISTNFASLNYLITADTAAGAFPKRFYRAAPVTPLPFDRTLTLNVVSNRTYVLQASTNLVNWVNISTNFATNNLLVVNDPAWLFYPMRFYRAAQVNTATTTGSGIGNVQLQPGNQIVFGYTSTPGRSYVMQSSTNLTTWVNVTTNVAGGTLLNFTNLIAPGVNKQFFRIMELQ